MHQPHYRSRMLLRIFMGQSFPRYQMHVRLPGGSSVTQTIYALDGCSAVIAALEKYPTARSVSALKVKEPSHAPTH